MIHQLDLDRDKWFIYFVLLIASRIVEVDSYVEVEINPLIPWSS